MEASFNRENSCVPPFGAEKFVNSRRRPDVLKQPLFEEQGRDRNKNELQTVDHLFTKSCIPYFLI